MEKFETNGDLTREQVEKLEELSVLLLPVFEKIDSDRAYEIETMMDELARSLEIKGWRMQEFYLWRLLTGQGRIVGPNLVTHDFDTPDGDIERLIRQIVQI